MKTVPTVPRTHHHFGTGVNAGYHDVKLHPTVLELKVLADRANWVPPPSDASATVVRLTRPAQLYPQEHQALFPFPRDPAGAGCPPPPRTHSPPQQPEQPAALEKEEEVVLPMSSLLWPTPFWYNGSLARPGKPVGRPDDYGYCKLLKDCGPVDVGEAVQVDKTDYYIPGQIADEGKCAEPEPEREARKHNLFHF
ncbi:uncharacterized protein LOC113202955 [Frankliniella occidentalis]|uniref:Uncharacterized protein LOC113202955 n=1 Tax=Frankliniella occidentalis TaxID=133901 RepID=A0A9C6X0L6_FRAOC|nr:uncharacterized protein LOC113202955 [Frankliniella occidentalis]